MFSLNNPIIIIFRVTIKKKFKLRAFYQFFFFFFLIVVTLLILDLESWFNYQNSLKKKKKSRKNNK
jgi:hypothetical protein